MIEDAEFATEMIELGSDPCTLFCYTDGVIEAMNPESELFSHQRMVESIHATEDPEPGSLIERMHDALADFTGEAPQSDDITMVAVRLC